jgi:hypothetical protein
MKGLYVLFRESQGMHELDSFEGDSIVILVVVDPATMASSFDDSLHRLERKAQQASARLMQRGVECKTVVEWGDRTEIVANAVQRENASLLNKG